MTQSPTTFLHLKSVHSLCDALISYFQIPLTELFFLKKFIYLPDLDLCFCARAFSLVVASGGYSLDAVRRLFTMVTSLAVEHRL